jgi:Icc-related predicted phosphoesterase
MKIAFASDLHTEASGIDLDTGDGDVFAAIGDIMAPRGRLRPGDEHEGVWWLRERVSDKPVLFVPGNHDYEGSKPFEALEAMRRSAEGSNVHVLWNDTVDIGGVRFLGTPLWSNPFQGREEQAAEIARAIENGTDLNRVYGDDGKPLPVQWVIDQHNKARKFLFDELTRDLHIPKVVLTHWAPSSRSQNPEYAKRITAGYWASDSEDLIALANLWLHGHIHDTVDYRIGDDPERGHVMSNPRGWSKTFGLPTNVNFFQPRIVEVAGHDFAPVSTRKHAFS